MTENQFREVRGLLRMIVILLGGIIGVLLFEYWKAAGFL